MRRYFWRRVFPSMMLVAAFVARVDAEVLAGYRDLFGIVLERVPNLAPPVVR